MTAETEVLTHPVEERPQTNEERILAFVADRPDGCSSFAIAIDTHIQRGAVEFILEKLEHQGRVQGTRNKKGIITWYPSGKKDTKLVLEPPAPPELPKPAPIAEEDEEAAAWKRLTPEDKSIEDVPERARCPVEGCGTMIIADREHMGGHLNHKHGNLQPRDRAVMLDRMYPRPRSPSLEDLKAEMEEDEGEEESVPAPAVKNRSKGDAYSSENQCPWCGCNNISAELLEKHKPGCPDNPDKKRSKPSPKSKSPPEERTCPDCGTEFPTKHGKKNHKCKAKKEQKAEKLATAERIDCPIDGCMSRPIRNKQNVRAHLAWHKLSLVEIHARLEQIFSAEGEASNAVQPPTPEPATEPVQAVQAAPVYTELPTELPTDELAEAPETAESLLGAVVNDRPGPEPVPIDDTVPPGSELLPPNGPVEPESDWQRPAASCGHCIDSKEDCVPTSIPPLCWRPKETLAGETPCEGDSCTSVPDPVLDAPFAAKPSGPPAPSGYVGRMINELPPAVVKLREDPLAELVRRHRVRVGREISKLKKVERKLRRRAAAAEAMADRVKAARRTKEKALDRFERDLEEVQGVPR